MKKAFTFVLIFFSLVDVIHSQSSYYLETFSYVIGDNNNEIQKKVVFSIDLQNEIFKKIQDGNVENFNIIGYQLGEEKAISNGIESTTTFECVSKDGIHCLWIFHSIDYFNSVSRSSMGYKNLSTGESIIYICKPVYN